MRTLLSTLFVLLATAFATPAAAQLDGTWELEHVNGAPLPANSPSEDGVVMEGLTVTLDAQAKYTIVLKARNSATGVPSVVEMTGTYRMEENRLHFQPDPGSTATPVDFHWEMDEGRLIWRDERDEYAFTRR